MRSIEGSIRSFVASKRQSEVLSLRREIVHEVNSHIQEELDDWGFQLVNLQINDISFDEAIMRYINGLDPTFMQIHNEVLYNEWVDITRGRRNLPGATIRARHD